MAHFNNIHKLVTFVNDYNTRGDSTTTLHNRAADPNYRPRVAIHEFEGLQDFQKETGMKDGDIAEAYQDAKNLGLLERYDIQMDPSIEWNRILVTDKGRKIARVRKLTLRTGKWRFVASRYKKPLQATGAMLGATAAIPPLVQFIFSLLPKSS